VNEELEEEKEGERPGLERLYSPYHSHADDNATSVSSILFDFVRRTACGDRHSGLD
jgi:hypothetical protein